MGDLSVVTTQLTNAAKSAARQAAGSVRRETSIVNRASALAGAALRPEKANGRKRPLKSGIYLGSGETKASVAGDGYVRRSPEQKTRVDDRYYKKRTKRIVGAIILAAIAAVVAYVLIKYFGQN